MKQTLATDTSTTEKQLPLDLEEEGPSPRGTMTCCQRHKTVADMEPPGQEKAG